MGYNNASEAIGKDGAFKTDVLIIAATLMLTEHHDA
jgi:hypothetical protein